MFDSRRFCPVFGFVAAAASYLIAPAARADAEIVVAMRYLIASGTSRAHLYLYREDGRLLRQLTKDDSGQDQHPIFAPDGETIVFTRQIPNGPAQYWSIQPRGGGLHRLLQAPDWYKSDTGSDYFTNITQTDPKTGNAINVPNVKNPPIFRAPDGTTEIVLRETEYDASTSSVGGDSGSDYELRVAGGPTVNLGKVPGFDGCEDLLYIRQAPNQLFLWENGLHLAFFGHHLDSSAGDTVYALDLTDTAHRRLVNLSTNWAAPFPLPGEPAFLTLTENRYVPISGTQKTANSEYVEHWDAHLKRVRYASPGAAVCYGASMYRPGKKPAIITIPSNSSED